MAEKKHLFLTGAKRVGKSTVLKKLLENRAVPGGFRTVRLPEDGGCAVYMVPPDGSEFTEANRVFSRKEGHLYLNAADFDRIGRELLESARGRERILMDELGPAEENALEFHRAVWAALDGKIPVYGVLQRAESGFLRQIADREDVLVVTVTEENRDALPRLLAEQGW